MNSFASRIGGKKALRDDVVLRFPAYYKTYIEVFGGVAWVLFHKPPGRDIEVYNDLDSLLSNLFLVVQEQPEALIEKLRYVVNSRENFEHARECLERGVSASNVQRASWTYQIIRFSYASGLTSYAAKSRDIWNDFPLIRQANRRLKRVVIEHQDFGQLIPRLDAPDSFFYCDPPYHMTEKYYQKFGTKGFTEQDHLRLQKLLLSIKGKFLLSYNDDPFVRDLYDQPGIYIEPVSRLNNMKQRVEPSSQFPELLISNYDPGERQQITLFQ